MKSTSNWWERQSWKNLMTSKGTWYSFWMRALNKNSGEVIGFVNARDTNNQLAPLEEACKSDKPQLPKIARQMLVFLVRGIFIHLQFPYSHFPTTSITSSFLSSMVWEAIRHLIVMGPLLTEISSSCWMGRQPTRPEIHTVQKKGGCFSYLMCQYYTKSLVPFIWAWEAVPTLGKLIYGFPSMTAACSPYCSSQLATFGWALQETSSIARLTLLPKLKQEHIELSLFSRMPVDLAAQVIITA